MNRATRKSSTRWLRLIAILPFFVAGCAGGNEKKIDSKTDPIPTVSVTPVVSRTFEKSLRLPGELTAYEEIAVHPKITGFVETVAVDIGTKVRRGQVLIRMKAPEILSQKDESEARLRAATEQRLQSEARLQGYSSQKAEAEARLAEEEARYKRLKAASATPGVVAQVDVEIAEQKVAAGRARIETLNANEQSARAEVESFRQNENAARNASTRERSMVEYLTLTAPFDGVITERNVSPGGLATAAAGNPLLRLKQISRLRLTVAVPEVNLAGIRVGTAIGFTVPAFPGETFTGTVRRLGNALDPKNRAMPVELDVENSDQRLSPGMFPEVTLPVGRLVPTLFVPPSAVAVTTDRTFVVRIRNGLVEWVDIKRGQSTEKLVEIFGALAEGDQVAVRGTDELRIGAKVQVKN
jgi:multidrug efflux pump subunit AcrA (membrane-fusion protein)